MFRRILHDVFPQRDTNCGHPHGAPARTVSRLLLMYKDQEDYSPGMAALELLT